MSEKQIEYKMRINYRSGHQHTGWFREFKVETSGGKLTSINYAHCDKSRFIHIGIQDIESITQLEYREKSV